MPGGRSVRVATHRLFVLGMTKHPPLVDVTQMESSSAVLLEQLLTGNNKIPFRISMNQTAELCHVAANLQFKNMLKLIENAFMAQRNNSMREAVDSLSVAVHFEMKEAVGKLVDEIVFGGHVDEELLMYCKNAVVLEVIMNRKSELLSEQQAPPLEPFVEIPPELAVVPRQQQPAMRKVMMNVARQKLKGIIQKPVNSLKTGFAWISNRRWNANVRQEF